ALLRLSAWPEVIGARRRLALYVGFLRRDEALELRQHDRRLVAHAAPRRGYAIAADRRSGQCAHRESAQEANSGKHDLSPPSVDVIVARETKLVDQSLQVASKNAVPDANAASATTSDNRPFMTSCRTGLRRHTGTSSAAT